ncbi:MAG: sporulation transcriptional regulator SpoIIID [Lachnospiraceae bacterium]|nr:sporulation transcriptional regulator SpoIIID [Lachnospiraceae bacterium]
MKDYIEERSVDIGNYIVENGATVRQTAAKFKISKSTVHKDVTVRLSEVDPPLASRVRSVLNLNKSERHIRGGMATKAKYLRIKNSFLHDT